MTDEGKVKTVDKRKRNTQRKSKIKFLFRNKSKWIG